MMQQMPELVKNGLDLAMREQGWAVAARRSKVSADEAGMGFQTIAECDAGDESIHPGSASLVFAREPIRIKGSDQGVVRRTALVVNLVVLYLRLPHGNSGLLDHANPVEPLNDLEHPAHN